MRGRSHTVSVGEKKLEWEDEQEVNCVNLLREAKPVVVMECFCVSLEEDGLFTF